MSSTIYFVLSCMLLFARTSNSHFLLNYPNSLGFDANNENSSPCGGFSISFSNASDFHVGGDSIALTTLHPQSNFLFRGTLDPTASGNWSNFLPVVGQYGLGAFCESSVTAPAAWAGSQGVIQVIQDAEDGVHYQCAAVNFVSGLVASLPSACTNASSVSASFTSDPALTSLSGSPSSTSSGSATAATTSVSTIGKSGARSSFGHVTSSAGWLLSALVLLLGAFL